jgi:hypothetical protein
MWGIAYKLPTLCSFSLLVTSHIILHITQPHHNQTTQPNKRGSKRGKAGRPEATQQPATLDGHNERQMCEKRWQLDKRWGCWLTEVALQQERQWLN